MYRPQVTSLDERAQSAENAADAAEETAAAAMQRAGGAVRHLPADLEFWSRVAYTPTLVSKYRQRHCPSSMPVVEG